MGRPSSESVRRRNLCGGSHAQVRSTCAMPDTNIAAIVEQFTVQVVAAIERSALERVQAAIAGTISGQGGAAARPRLGPPALPHAPRSVTITPKQMRARQLQGRYLGAMRPLSMADKAKVKSVAKTKGVAEALKLALSLRKST